MKSLGDKLKEKKTNKIEQAEKMQEKISALVAKLDENQKIQTEQRSVISDLSAKLDHLTQKDFRFDNYTTNEIRELKNSLKNVSIPEEVKLSRQIDFSEITSKVIYYFFLLALPIVAISLYFGINGYQQRKEAELLREQTRTIELHNRLAPFKERIRVDSQGWYYLEFNDPKGDKIKNYTEFGSQYRNGKYDKRIRVYLGK